MKWFLLVAFLLIGASLVSAMVFLVRDRGKTRNVARALTIRVALSIALFALLWLSHWMGWIQSTGVPLRVPN